MSEYHWDKTSITFTWLSCLYNPFKDTFFNRSPLVVASGFFLLSRSFLHFILKWQDCKNFTKLVPSKFFLGFTKLNPKAVAQMCSIKKLFLEISQNSQENMCRNLFLNKVAAFRPINSIIKCLAHAVLYW